MRTLILISLFYALPLWANWSLDGQSELYFISIKKDQVAELHHFTQMQGQLTDKGQVHIQIDLSSVETAIPIRNERMKALLFAVDQFPKAEVQAQINLDALSSLKPGQMQRQSIEFELNLHGQSKVLKAEVQIIALDNGALLVNAVRPIIINAADFELVAGIEKLRQIAKLPSISTAVPVNFELLWQKQ